MKAIAAVQPNIFAARHSASMALAWYFWRRVRPILIFLVPYGLILGVLIHTGALQAFNNQFGAADDIFFLLPLLGAGEILMIFVVRPEGFGKGDAEPGMMMPYPTHLLARPMRTQALVGWHMLFATLAMALYWLCIVMGIINPAGANVPVVWPMVMLSAYTASFQAMASFPQRGMGQIGTLVAILLLLVIAVVTVVHARDYGIPDWALIAFYVAMTAGAYFAAVLGVARWRRGDIPGSMPGRTPPVAHPRSDSTVAPLRSRVDAQLWHDWRCHGTRAVTIVATLCTFLAPFIFLQTTSTIGRQDDGIDVRIWVTMMAAIIMMAPLIAMMFGVIVWPTPHSSENAAVCAFLATRPISAGEAMQAKLRMTALSVLAPWGLLIPAAMVCLLLPATDNQGTASLIALLAQRATFAHLWALAAATAIAFILLTWNGATIGIYFTAIPSRWAPSLGPVLFVTTLAVPMAVLAGVLTMFPSIWPHLPAVAAVLLPVKVAVAVIVCAWLARRRLVEPAALAKTALGWLACVVALFVISGLLVPFSIVPAWELVATVAVLVPFNRICLRRSRSNITGTDNSTCDGDCST